MQHRLVHGGDALGDPDRAGDSAVADDRDSRGEDLLAERPRVPLHLNLVAGQRMLDLGPALVARADLRGSGAVDEHADPGVDDQYPSAHRARSVRASVAQLAPVARSQQVGGGRRDEVGLACA